MSELTPYPLAMLSRRMLRELDESQAIFDLPASRFVRGSAQHDLSVTVHGHAAATPLGPAAGPHTQLAQNIVLSWLAGGRVIELKTVQVNDRLAIARPCIDMRTVGYNVEWSQELTLEQSLAEYVKAAMLIRILQECGRLPPMAPGLHRTVFDMSVGYDLAGIRSERVQTFLAGMVDASAVIERLRRELPPELGPLRDLDFDPCISDTLTLSTFHGCPPDEIEAMATHLMQANALHCVVKLNPTLLGAQDLRGLLHGALGYSELDVPDSAFEKDAQWDQAAAFLERLHATAHTLGRGFGVKFSNTLLVENHRKVFPQSERHMYLSGAPLHVLAMHLVRKLRREFGDRYPLSFSAGITRDNFADAVALGLAPVTVCSDWLQVGGYGRGLDYFDELTLRMDEAGAATVDEFVMRAYAGARGGTPGGAGAGGGDASARGTPPTGFTSAELSSARLRNTERYVEGLAADPRYHAAENRKPPYKMGRQLALFDCIACDKCIGVCPNNAIFALPVPAAPLLPLKEPHQIAVFADFCNECGNCDAFCPEDGGPYKRKPRLFVDRERWLADAPRDAILIEAGRVVGRFEGQEVEVQAWTRLRDDPRVQALCALREAVVADGGVNPVAVAMAAADQKA